MFANMERETFCLFHISEYNAPMGGKLPLAPLFQAKSCEIMSPMTDMMTDSKNNLNSCKCIPIHWAMIPKKKWPGISSTLPCTFWNVWTGQATIWNCCFPSTSRKVLKLGKPLNRTLEPPVWNSCLPCACSKVLHLGRPLLWGSETIIINLWLSLSTPETH